MRPLSLSERRLVEPTVSLVELLTGTRPVVEGESPLDLADYVDEILATGFPAIRRLPPRPRRRQLDGYLARLVQRDFTEQGLRVRRPETLQSWLTAYAAATATTTSYNTLLRAATAGEDDKPAKTTTIAYRDVLSQLWMIDPVPGWLPARNHVNRLTQSPKHHLADPGLAAHLLNLDPRSLLGPSDARREVQGDAILGRLFESLVTLSVRTYAQAADTRVRHLRTGSGRHEVDLIVEGPGLRVLAIEVKLSTAPDDADVRHLSWLREQLGDDLLDAVVLTTGRYAYRRPDGIAVVPAALLGP